MRFVVYGAGAVGGSLAALLARAGHDVVIIARGEHLKAIQEKGLLLGTRERGFRVRIPAVSDPSELVWHEDDVVLLGVKSQDTDQAIRGLDRSLPIVCLQNGVANESLALRYFARVYGVCVMFPSTHLEPGVVEANSWPVAGILDLGRIPSGVDSLAGEIAAAFREAGCSSETRPDIMAWKYRKLLMNLGNAVQAVCAPEAVPGLAKLVSDEGARVLEQLGIEAVSEEEDLRRRGDLLQVDARRGGGSSWQSLKRGTGSIESDYLNGEIVWLARRNGLPAPYNENARTLANLFAAQRLSPGTMSSEEWLSTLAL